MTSDFCQREKSELTSREFKRKIKHLSVKIREQKLQKSGHEEKQRVPELCLQFAKAVKAVENFQKDVVVILEERRTMVNDLYGNQIHEGDPLVASRNIGAAQQILPEIQTSEEIAAGPAGTQQEGESTK